MSQKQVGRIWYASCGRVYEVHLLDDHTCVVPPDDVNTRPIPLSLLWGMEGNIYVFRMRRMPAGIEQLRLPIIVEGGWLTGNYNNAVQMSNMLKGVATQASMAALQIVNQTVSASYQQCLGNLQAVTPLPTILEPGEGDEDVPPAPQAVQPQASEDDQDDDDDAD